MLPPTKANESELHVSGFPETTSLNGKYFLLNQDASIRPTYAKGDIILSFFKNQSDIQNQEDDHSWQFSRNNQCLAKVKSICQNPLDCPLTWNVLHEDETCEDETWKEIYGVRILESFYSELDFEELEKVLIQTFAQLQTRTFNMPSALCNLICCFVDDIIIDITLEDIQGWWRTTKTECAFVSGNVCKFDNFGQQFPIEENEKEFVMNNWHLGRTQSDYFSNMITWTGGQHWNTAVKWFRLSGPPSNFIQPIVSIKRAHYPEVVGDYAVCGQSDFVPKFRKIVNDNLMYEIARNLHVEPGPTSEQKEDFAEQTSSDEQNSENVTKSNRDGGAQESSVWFIYKIHHGQRTNLYRTQGNIRTAPIPPHTTWMRENYWEVPHLFDFPDGIELEFNQQARRLTRILPPIQTGNVNITITLPSHIAAEELTMQLHEQTCDAQIVYHVKRLFAKQLIEAGLCLKIDSVSYDLNSREAVKEGKYEFFYDQN